MHVMEVLEHGDRVNAERGGVHAERYVRRMSL